MGGAVGVCWYREYLFSIWVWNFNVKSAADKSVVEVVCTIRTIETSRQVRE